MILILIVIVYLILLDELVMSSAQRRFGPFNIGVFGLLASIVNGINLILVQSYFIMSSYSFIMFLGPLIFLFILLLFFEVISPLFVIDISYIFFIIILLSSLLIFVYFLLSYASFTKYSILGSFRILISFLAFGLVFDILIAIFLYTYSFLAYNLSSLSFLSYHDSLSSVLKEVPYLLFAWAEVSFRSLFSIPLMLFIVFNLAILVESNRVPFDLPEAESELVAGFMTEFSSIYFSIIILSEYFSLIIFSLFLVLLFNLYVLLSLFLLFFWCLARATLNRFKFDELIVFGWYFCLLLVFSIFMLLIFIF